MKRLMPAGRGMSALRLILFVILFSQQPSGASAAAVAKVETEAAFAVAGVEVSPDGETVIAAFSDGSIRSFTSTGRFVSSVKLPGAIKSMSLTSQGKKLFIAAGKPGLVTLEDGHTAMFDEAESRINAVTADKAGRTGVISRGSAIVFYNLESGKAALTLRAPAEIHSLAVDDSTATLFAGGKDGVVRAFSMLTGQLITEAQAEIGVVRCIAVSASGILAAGDRGVAYFSKDLLRLRLLSRHSDDVRSVRVTPDGRFSVSGGDDGVPVVWNIAADTATSAYADVRQPISAVAIDPYFRYIVVGTAAAGGTSGTLSIQYTSNRNEVRHIYAFRDATATLTKAGYADGDGPFGKYITYEDGDKKYTFSEMAQVVHKPEKMDYAMPRPDVALKDAPLRESAPVFKDITPPVISVNTRGFAPVAAGDIRTIEGTVSDDSGIAWARVDGRPLQLSSKGEFKIEISAGTARTVIISAADIYGNSAEAAVAVGAESPPKAGAGRNYALLIGINGYRHLPALRTAEYDARSLEQALKSGYGYETSLLIGRAATRNAVMTEINSLRRKLTTGDRLIIYYAGHGERNRASGNVYWQPYDAMPDDDSDWIPTAQLTAAFAAFNAPVLVVADSCYSGAIRDKSAVTGGNTVVLLSGGGDEPVADSGKDGHSVFTGALLTALRSQPVNTESLMRILKENMPQGGQVPEYHILSGKTDFILR